MTTVTIPCANCGALGQTDITDLNEVYETTCHACDHVTKWTPEVVPLLLDEDPPERPPDDDTPAIIDLLAPGPAARLISNAEPDMEAELLADKTTEKLRASVAAGYRAGAITRAQIVGALTG